ncbi:MAG: hypothetical protein OHK0029_24560 [Armatimonadaceae bacterium]
MTIELEPEIERRLQTAAAIRGEEPSILANSLLNTVLPREAEDERSQQTLADVFAGHIGGIQGSGEAHSEETGKRFTQLLLEKRHKQGNL